ncbi:hypothetical protein OMP38_03220 [Cohnella ginsengisoli]|uniref:Uncharacterized protein n=1 Tax=Cohnella ginsengisoli TaxID=425004 RepID=A0A9X4KD70_9BACL|nr:hypothetical protein [Cohnella ginsengisoli]MDG0789974.1 hypothetical protein [Cohnella ginsengisoli]
MGISEARKSALKIEFYLKDNVPYSSEMNAVNTKLRTSKFIKNKRRDLLSLYKEITERTIEQKDRNDPNDEDEEIFKRLRISIGMSMTIYSEISGKRRKELESLAHELLEVQMNDEFFLCREPKRTNGTT